MTRADIVIAGGGPAGCAAAIEALARRYSVALLEAGVAGRRPHLGEIAPAGEYTADSAHSLEAESFVHWSGAGIGVAASSPSVHLDKEAFNRNLRQEAIRRGALYLPDTRVLGLERNGGRWRIDSTSGPMESVFLIDATGRAAAIGRKLGARRVAFDRLTAATVTFAESGRPTQRLVEAAENGWWFCANHPRLGTVGTYFTDSDLRTDFEGELRRSRFAKAFLGAQPVERPRVLAAGTARLEPVAGPGWFAVGDAAWSCDPLSSSGIGNAFRMAAWALEAGECYAGRMADEFADYLRSYRSVYGSAARTGEFWQRRTGAA